MHQMGRRTDTGAAVEELVRLRSVEAQVDPALRRELRSVREFLEALVGPTVTRAETARLLKISQTALERWIANAEIPSVVTPEGGREVPLSAVVNLVEDVERAREHGIQRPLASVIRKRRQSSEEIDVER